MLNLLARPVGILGQHSVDVFDGKSWKFDVLYDVFVDIVEEIVGGGGEYDGRRRGEGGREDVGGGWWGGCGGVRV